MGLRKNRAGWNGTEVQGTCGIMSLVGNARMLRDGAAWYHHDYKLTNTPTNPVDPFPSKCRTTTAS